MKINKDNLPLIIAFGLPVLLIIIITAFVYLPSLFIRPTNKFIYSIRDNYYSYYEYKVENGKITKESTGYDYGYHSSDNSAPTLFLYDPATGRSNELSYYAAMNYNISNTGNELDGWTVGPSSNYSGLFFSSSSYGKIYLKGHGVTKQIDLNGKESYFDFIGWVEE